jgi:hypothetical protein
MMAPGMSGRRCRSLLAGCILVSNAGAVPDALALADGGPFGGWLIEVSNIVSPSHPTAVVRVSAWFDYVPGVSEAYAGGRFDLTASEGGFANYRCLLSCGFPPPQLESNQIRFVRPNQTVSPWNPANPIPVFEVEWTSYDPAPRVVALATSTAGFFTHVDLTSPAFYIFPPEALVEGEAIIEVRPDCFPDCDSSSGRNVLDIFDFLCFQNLFTTGSNYACDCDTSTGQYSCDIFDFLCFQNAFATGCP